MSLYRIGIDGGGSGTRAVLADADGHLLGRGSAAASALNQGVDKAWSCIDDAMRAAFAAAGLHPAAPAQCALGVGI